VALVTVGAHFALFDVAADGLGLGGGDGGGHGRQSGHRVLI
jgi:hypothetical protein